MEFGRVFLFVLLIITGGVAPLIAIIGIYLHLRMSNIFDSQLFNNKYFSEFELATFKSFPLSILKTLSYIRGTVAPNSIKKRFGNFDFKQQLPTYIIWVNIFWSLLLVLAFFALIISVLALIVDIFVFS